MYYNLKETMHRENVGIDVASKALGIHRNSVSNKINGDSDFTIAEANALWEIFFKRYDFRWLFQTGGKEGKESA